jgi:Serine aminopeptidase, S33
VDRLPIEVFDGLRRDVAAGPFYDFNRPGAKPLEGVIENWRRQGMTDGTKAHYDGIKAFSETDQTEHLKNIEVPTLVMHGEDDQIVPYKDAGLLAIKLLKLGTLKIYPGFPHGMLTTRRRDQPGYPHLHPHRKRNPGSFKLSGRCFRTKPECLIASSPWHCRKLRQARRRKTA